MRLMNRNILKCFKKFLKIKFLTILLLSLNFNISFSKQIPPGSGEGDVPANILIMLDSSKSMNQPIQGGPYLGLTSIEALAQDSEGNIYASTSEKKSGTGIIKIIAKNDDGTIRNQLDKSFAKGNVNFRGYEKDRDCGNAKSNVAYSYAMDITSQDILYFGSYTGGGRVIAIDKNGICKKVWANGVTGIAMPTLLTISTLDNEEILFVGGTKHPTARLWVRNLTTGVHKRCNLKNGGNFLNYLLDGKTEDMTVSKGGPDSGGKYYLFIARAGHLFGFELAEDNNGVWCPKDRGEFSTLVIDTKRDRVTNIDTMDQTSISKSIDAVRSVEAATDDDTLYISTYSHRIQKLEIDWDNTQVNLIASLGKYGTGKNESNASIAAADVQLSLPGKSNYKKAKTSSLFYVSSNRIIVGNSTKNIDELDEDKFNADQSDLDTAWLARYGGGALSRWQGAKAAIEYVVSDGALTSGANFGYGYWNGGLNNTKGNRSKTKPGEKYCHKKGDCFYPAGWIGDHPEGQTKQCDKDSCIKVGIGPENGAEIITEMGRTPLEFATDGNAFADHIYHYFNDTADEINIIQENKPCALNYVIVISDGFINNTEAGSRAINQIKSLRQDMDVKTLFVAYGGTYDDERAKKNFDRLALAGSCDDPASIKCEPTIVASKPEDLKAALVEKIAQIIADRLSFTAPSITASVREGGSVYQAQFNYASRGEWEGKLLRKVIDGFGNVLEGDNKCNEDGVCNWDAGELLATKGSANRNIWTVFDTSTNTDAKYNSTWNNWGPDYSDEIETLFFETGNEVKDYHNSSSTCKGIDGVEDGTADDLIGLINFVRGQDYFDYNGGCDLTEDRASILADIYHSQLIEVGAPGANTDFSNNNQEAYWRSINGYETFRLNNINRKKILYAGSNAGMLHAFDANSGEELWAFIPPMIGSKLPLLMNTGYDGAFDNDAGGSNAIFGVDGSPVAHDVYIYGLKQDLSGFEASKSWRTILFVPYGRGGRGFAVLDVTNPEVASGTNGGDGSGPLFMYSVFNDVQNNKVLRVDHTGYVTEHGYTDSNFFLSESREAQTANENYRVHTTSDGDSDTDFTVRDSFNPCQTNSDVSDSSNTNPDDNFAIASENTCYSDYSYSWNMPGLDKNLYDTASGSVTKIQVYKLSVDQYLPTTFSSAKYDKDTEVLTIKFSSKMTFNAGTAEDPSSDIKITTSCAVNGTADRSFDYSQLGETWSTPRIFRAPTATGGNIMEDRYIAVMGGGYSVGSECGASNIYMVDLEAGPVANTSEGDSLEIGLGKTKGGSLFMADVLDGPLRILDSAQTNAELLLPSDQNSGAGGVDYPNASDISNYIPASPVVITSDAGKTVPWRGALVYINDFEGKITKINLTSQPGRLFERQTLMNLRANTINKRYSFFEMDGAIGQSTGNLWLFGGTGDFNRIADTGDESGDLMDNIIYGIKDADYPLFKSRTKSVPAQSEANFVQDYINEIDSAPLIDLGIAIVATSTNDDDSFQEDDSFNVASCAITTNAGMNECLVKITDGGWVVHLGIDDGLNWKQTKNTFRKLSASPTVYRGQVYFPIYEPDKLDNCKLGKAYICSRDDECGFDVSGTIDQTNAAATDASSCYFVDRGILSKLVVFGDYLFANLAGPEESEDTLIKILGAEGTYKSFRKSWRENF